MDFIIKLGTGIAAALFGAAVLYSFRMRQLYLLIPKMFSHCDLFEQGRLIEIRVFNRGNNMEEDVQIDMPPELKYELLASEQPGVKFSTNTIKLDRLAQRSEVSILILAEGVFNGDSFMPSITSKLAKGRLFKKLDEIPPNAGSTVLVVGLFVFVISIGIYAPNKYFEHKRVEAEKEKQELLEIKEREKEALREKYSYLHDLGWQGVEEYINSDLRMSYSDFEFPVTLIDAKTENRNYILNFVAVNKTSSSFRITGYFDSNDENLKGRPLLRDSVFDLFVKPMDSKSFFISMRRVKDMDIKDVFVKFSIKYGDEYLFDLKLFPVENSIANKELQRTSR